MKADNNNLLMKVKIDENGDHRPAQRMLELVDDEGDNDDNIG